MQCVHMFMSVSGSCMRGARERGLITRPPCTEHQRLSGWAVWPAEKNTQTRRQEYIVNIKSLISAGLNKYSLVITLWLEMFHLSVLA